jgi:apolipoprotein N-acyltransferase
VLARRNRVGYAAWWNTMNRKDSTKAVSTGPAASSVAARPSFLHDAGQVILLYALTLGAFSCIFAPARAWPPGGTWPLTFVCLVPWAVATCRTRRAWLVHWLSFFLGYGFFLINLFWLYPVTDLGYYALAFYLGLYWPLAAWALRTGQRHGVSPLWTLPVAWVACEYLRAWVMTGFPWLFLAHAFYEQSWLIQISDLTGAYGVSFLAALVNGVLTAFILRRWPHPDAMPRPRQLWIGAALTLVELVGTLAYGYYRTRQTDFQPGPRIAVIQHDFPLVSKPPWGERPWVIFAEYVRLAADAVITEKPDAVVFPETVWSATQNNEFLAVELNAVDDVPSWVWPYSRICHKAIAAFARGDYAGVNREIDELERYERHYSERKLPRLPVPAGGAPPVTVILGAQSVETFPKVTYPKVKRYNSALLYDPDGVQRPQRYDKNHLVPFGESVPFRHGSFHWLYRRLNDLSPFSDGGRFEYSLSPGRELTVFELKTSAGTTRFGTPICYEDVMPYLARRYVWGRAGRRVDFLVNLSNDGWFIHSAELPQHLAIGVFRAVENRTGMARAVNTGISGFIDPNGRIYSAVETDGRRFGPGVVGYRVDRVQLDRRTTLYGWAGDWFAAACLGLTAVLWIVAVAERWVLAMKQRIAAWRTRGEREHADLRRAK